MTNDRENLYRPVRESASNKLILGLLGVGWVLAVVANHFAGHGPIDGWLIWNVFFSAFLMMVAFAVIGIVRIPLGRSVRLDDFPSWFIRAALALTVAYLGIAALLVVTP